MDGSLIPNNFGRRKNDPAKDRKALVTYVELRGYKNGENQWGRQNGTTTKSTLDEIARELNMSTGNLRRILRIERNLTDSMKELSVYYVLIISCVKDFGVIWDIRSVHGELVGGWNLYSENVDYSLMLNTSMIK